MHLFYQRVVLRSFFRRSHRPLRAEWSHGSSERDRHAPWRREPYVRDREAIATPLRLSRRPPRAAFGFRGYSRGVGAGWKSIRFDEIEPIPVVDGTLLWRPVRRTLDIGAFGINAYVAPNAGEDVVEEHTEQSLGHEEVYVVLAGRATFTLDDETLDAPAGTVVFVRDPSIKRHARADEPGTQVLAVGGPRDEAYEPSPWEDYFAAERHRNAGDYDAYADELAEALERRPDHPATLYNLACAEALAGRREDALGHLRRALELKPEWAEQAGQDEDFASLRDDPDWPL
jgi:tetratricopeptide (TPR) repeat protein